MTLDEIAIKYGTDKASWEHDYCKTYELLLGHKRQDITAVLEIGIGKGYSLKMWKEYFPNANIYGIDIINNKLLNEDRIKCFYANQGNAKELIEVVQQFDEKFDIIIDDASHEYNAQIISNQVLMPCLKKGGLYVIEDVPMGDREGLLILTK